MTKISNDSMNVIQKVSLAVFAAYVADGGIIRDYDDHIAPEVVASRSGCLPALMWLFVEKFAREMNLPAEYGIPQKVIYSFNDDTYTGVYLEEFSVDVPEAMTVMAVTDFFRKEVVQANLVDLDLGDLIVNFREWCRDNVVLEAGVDSSLLANDLKNSPIELPGLLPE